MIQCKCVIDSRWGLSYYCVWLALELLLLGCLLNGGLCRGGGLRRWVYLVLLVGEGEGGWRIKLEFGIRGRVVRMGMGECGWDDGWEEESGGGE